MIIHRIVVCQQASSSQIEDFYLSTANPNRDFVEGEIPFYLGGGLMWEPMAIGIIVGLLFGTIITLLFVPILYRLLYRVKPS